MVSSSATFPRFVHSASTLAATGCPRAFLLPGTCTAIEAGAAPAVDGAPRRCVRRSVRLSFVWAFERFACEVLLCRVLKMCCDTRCMCMDSLRRRPASGGMYVHRGRHVVGCAFSRTCVHGPALKLALRARVCVCRVVNEFAAITGPADTPYAGGEFKLEVVAGDRCIALLVYLPR